MTNETLLEITQRVNLLKIIIDALFKDLAYYKKYLTAEEKVEIFLFLEYKPLNELLLLWRTQDYKEVVETLALLTQPSAQEEEE